MDIIFGGDVSFYGPIDKNFIVNNCPYDDMFQGLRSIFKQADYVIINLESTLGTEKELSKYKNEDKVISFVSNPKTLISLA